MNGVLGFLFIGLAAGLSYNIGKDQTKAAHDHCNADPETHVNDEPLHQFHNIENLEHQEKVDSHLYCASMQLGLQKTNGHIDAEYIRKVVSDSEPDQDEVENIVKECATEKDTPEHTARHLFICLMKKNIYDYYESCCEHHKEHHDERVHHHH